VLPHQLTVEKVVPGANHMISVQERALAQLHSSLGSVGMYSVNEHDVPPMPQKPHCSQLPRHVRGHRSWKSPSCSESSQVR
jgi:hypothetical protein